MLTAPPRAAAGYEPRSTAPHDPMLRIENIEKSFPVNPSLMTWAQSFGRVPRRRVLHGISFTVGRGELFGLLGENGAGKTSLLKMLATLSIPDRGRILLDGVDVVRHPLEARRRIGLCTAEERSFYYRMTGRANLRFFGALVGLRGRALRERIDDVAQLVDLIPALDRRFHSYSSGMRQRLTVARALLADPDVLFLDEPTRAVDPVHAEALHRLIRDELVTRRGKTVVLATNLLEEAWSLCDRIAMIDAGTVVAIGTAQSLAASMRERQRYQIVVDAISDLGLRTLQDTPGVRSAETWPHEGGGVRLEIEIEPLDDALTRVLATVAGGGIRVRAIRSIEPEPMDVFKHLTGGLEP